MLSICLRSLASLDLHPSIVRWPNSTQQHAKWNTMSLKPLTQATVSNQLPCTTKTIAALAPTISPLLTTSIQLLPQPRTRRPIRPQWRLAWPLFMWPATTPPMVQRDIFQKVITLPLNKAAVVTQVRWLLSPWEPDSLLSQPSSCEWMNAQHYSRFQSSRVCRFKICFLLSLKC